MTDYMAHLYKYITQRRSPNRKLLLTWIQYIQERNIPDGECYSESLEFMMNHPYAISKSKTTRRNYSCEINKFNEYVYEQEGWTLPWNKINQHTRGETNITSPPIIRTSPLKEKKRTPEKTSNTETTTNKEYAEFLKKYEELNK